jgi:uncharacterized protein (DUF924 family)
VSLDEALGVREFWFGKLWTSSRPEGELRVESLAELTRQWFGSDSDAREQRDAQIRDRFGGLVERAASGALAAWADSPRRRLSLIILLDQFPRHIYRQTAQAFAYDESALALSLSGMQSAADAALNPVERLFFYMPLQHSESTDVQEESVAAYRRLLAEADADIRSTFAAAMHSAQEHRELIRQFGRFPHRNRVLGRSNTAAESEWLAKHPHDFGQ